MPARRGPSASTTSSSPRRSRYRPLLDSKKEPGVDLLRARIHAPSIALSIALAALLAGIAAACSLTTSLDGLATGPADDGGGTALVEGGAIAVDGGDGGGGQTTDSSTDASIVDAAPVPFRCVDHPEGVYCADFEGTPVSKGWSNVQTVAGGTLTAVEGRFGLGLAAGVPSYNSPTEPIASLENSLPLNNRQDFTYSVDTFIESLTASGQVDFIAFGFHGPFYILVLRAGGGGHVDLYEFGSAFGTTAGLDHYQPLLIQPKLGSWMHVVGHVTFTTGNVHLKLTFDGATAFDGDLQANPWVSQPYVYAGITQASGGGSKAISIRFDDLLVTTP